MVQMILEDIERIAIVLLAAMLLDGIFGDPKRLYRLVPHPIALLGGVIAWLEKRLNRGSHAAAMQFFLGAAMSFALIAFALLLGWLAMKLCAWLPGGIIIEALLASVLLAGRGLYDQVAACADALAKSASAGRDALAALVGRDPKFLDDSGIAKAAIESLGENFSDAIVAPLFWGLLLGLPGLVAYKTINTLDSMVGYRSEKHFWFGKFAARIDDLANFIPARLSALLVCLASMATSSTSWRGAAAAVTRDARRHASWNAGWPEAAFAGALGIAIAGPRRSAAGETSAAWMGKEGRARLGVKDIHLALGLYLRTCLLVVILLGALALTGLP